MEEKKDKTERETEGDTCGCRVSVFLNKREKIMLVIIKKILAKKLKVQDHGGLGRTALWLNIIILVECSTPTVFIFV